MASSDNDPPSVLTWQIAASDVDDAITVCQSADIRFEIEHNDTAPGWSYRRLILRASSGCRFVLEGPTE
jgi:hypothetical protein